MKLFCTEKKMFSIRFSQVNLACFPYPGTYIVFCRYIPPQQKSGRKSARKSFDGKSFPLALCFDFCGKVYPHKLLFFCSVRPSGSRNPLQTLDNGYLEKLFLPANPGLWPIFYHFPACLWCLGCLNIWIYIRGEYNLGRRRETGKVFYIIIIRKAWRGGRKTGIIYDCV